MMIRVSFGWAQGIIWRIDIINYYSDCQFLSTILQDHRDDYNYDVHDNYDNYDVYVVHDVYDGDDDGGENDWQKLPFRHNIIRW